MNRIKAQIISSIVTITAIVSLLGFGMTSYAWFHKNKKVEAKTIAISSVADSKFNFTYDLYYKDNIENTIVHKDSTTDTFDLSLKDYDSEISESTSVFKNILKVNVNFFESDSSKTKKFTTKVTNTVTTPGATYSGGEGTATRKHLDSTGFKYNYTSSTTTGQFLCDTISNLIQFKYFVYSVNIGNTTYLPSSSRTYLVNTTKTIDYTSATTTYNTASSIFDDQSNVDTFVNGSSKVSEISESFSNIPGEVKSMVFFIEYNYSQSLVTNYVYNNEYLKNREFGDTFNIADLNLNVDFKKDIEMIKFQLDTVNK